VNLHLLHLECFDIVFFNRKSSLSTCAHLPRRVIHVYVTVTKFSNLQNAPSNCLFYNLK